jgi:hypothetical protein
MMINRFTYSIFLPVHQILECDNFGYFITWRIFNNLRLYGVEIMPGSEDTPPPHN